MDLISETFYVKLYPDSEWKEKCLSKMEIIFEDRRNENILDGLERLENFLEYGGEYELTMSLKKK